MYTTPRCGYNEQEVGVLYIARQCVQHPGSNVTKLQQAVHHSCPHFFAWPSFNPHISFWRKKYAEVKIRCLTAAEGSKMSREVTFQVGLEKSNLLSDFKEKQKQIWFYSSALLLQGIKSTVLGDLWPPEQTSQPNLSEETKKIKGRNKFRENKIWSEPRQRIIDKKLLLDIK